MKNYIKFICVILAAVIVAAMIPFTVAALEENGYTYTVKNNEATITKYTGEDAEVTIPDALGGYPVTAIGEEAFLDKTAVTSITVPGCVKRIDQAAFAGCSALKTFVAEEGLEFADGGLFRGCSALESVTLPSTLTEIPSWGFANCEALTELAIPENVTVIRSRAFFNCKGLTEIVVPDKVVEIQKAAFEKCTSLKTVYLPASLTTVVKSYSSSNQDTFTGCENLTDVYYAGTAEQWKTLDLKIAYPVSTHVSVHIMGSSEEEEYILNNFQYNLTEDGVTITRYVGEGGDATVPAVIEGKPVTAIGQYAFAQKPGLTSVTIPSSVIEIGECAFLECPNLKTVTIGDGIQKIGNQAFDECTSLESIVFPDSVTEMGTSVLANCSSLKSVTLPKNIKSLPNGTFGQCSSLTEVTVPEGVTLIGIAAFSDCTSLTKVTLPSTVNDIRERAFAYCTSLAEIEIPEGVKQLHVDTFNHCAALETVTLPLSLHVVNYSAFRECEKLSEVRYNGTLALWERIQIDKEDNDALLSANVVCKDEIDTLDSSSVFDDVGEKAWFRKSVDFVYTLNFMNGMSEKTFAPNVSTSRAMLVTVLWRVEGSPIPGKTAGFADLKAGWYRDAVNWAYEHDIVNGLSETSFDPNGELTREQIATIMYRYSEYIGHDVSGSADISEFPDGAKTHNYAKKAMAWATADGLISGVKAGNTNLLDPLGNATRAQVATILTRQFG